MKTWYNEQIVGVCREVYKGFDNKRSPLWRQARKTHLIVHSTCEVCGKKEKGIHVHHIVPFSIDPSLELDPRNFLTLCRKHHFLFGHLLYWKSYNANVLIDCIHWRKKLRERP